jgi:hypothetical protein
MTIFDRLEYHRQRTTGELNVLLTNLLNEGMERLQKFGKQLDTETMRDLNGWWVRAEHVLTKCGPVPQ